jgi:signal transduction histidine kinase
MLGLRQKLLLAFSAFFLLLVMVAWSGMVVIERVSQSFDRIFRENLTTIHACRTMSEVAEEMNRLLLMSLWEGATMDTARVRNLAGEFERNLGFQTGNITVKGERALTDTLASAWADFRSRYFGSLESSAPVAVRREAYRSEVGPAFRAIQQSARSISELNSRNILSADGQVRAQARSARRTMTALLTGGGVLVLLMLAFMGRLVLKPIRALRQSAQEIEKGNLDLSLQVRSRDELGQLAEAFNAMAARLREFRRSDQARLLRTQRTTQTAINSLPDAIAVLGQDGTVEMSNEPAVDLFGIKPGVRANSLGLPWLGPLVEKVVREARPSHPQSYEGAVQVFREGRESFYLPHAIPLLDEAGSVNGVTLVLADVTDLRRLDETKSDLLSTVSHELKTRLTSVRMAVHLLLDEKVGALDNRQVELLVAAREDSEHLHRIIEGLLDIARIRSGRMKMEAVPLDADELVLRAVEDFQHAFQDKGVKLLQELPPELPKVMADPSRIPLVLDNLLPMP